MSYRDRAMNLQDMFSILNNNVQNALNTDINATEIVGQLVVADETIDMADSGTASVHANTPKWDSAIWNEFLWQ